LRKTRPNCFTKSKSEALTLYFKRCKRPTQILLKRGDSLSRHFAFGQKIAIAVQRAGADWLPAFYLVRFE